ncbi:YggS family pyridoxal phosphate-dependent enzyme [Salegentibacter sp. LM13S]|uniref:YggS family pyridoxal phosphate-dependent enzyme n=1 Tax=Salegentibacter lacus TaxID=2873599 RepID=UPI001CCC7E31|nr:YggS family pyridoxal phosphate-dependent enzyme [Salegentibacter lacus]MBZ9630445.1 YggS family pyridoxal phosphate-dependent enzyme [Salegentibacter lacus]
MKDILSNLSTVKRRITNTCEKTGRNSSDVKLLLATKTVAADKIEIALAQGETLIGENKVQELKEKFETLQTIPHQTHFIGHLQSNKIKEVLKYVDCIQSVDRISLVNKLQKRLDFEDKTIDVFIQVNTSYENSKFGIEPKKALDFALKLKAYERINIKGLMTIGLFSADNEKVRNCFRMLKNIQYQMLDKGIPSQELSMGMSGDLETAIEEGSTMIRVGTAIFGKRHYPDSYYWNETK